VCVCVYVSHAFWERGRERTMSPLSSPAPLMLSATSLLLHLFCREMAIGTWSNTRRRSIIMPPVPWHAYSSSQCWPFSSLNYQMWRAWCCTAPGLCRAGLRLLDHQVLLAFNGRKRGLKTSGCKQLLEPRYSIASTFHHHISFLATWFVFIFSQSNEDHTHSTCMREIHKNKSKTKIRWA